MTPCAYANPALSSMAAFSLTMTVFDRIAAPNIAFVAGRSMGWAIRAALPWLAILLAFLVIVTYVPEISLTLPNLIDQWRGIK